LLNGAAVKYAHDYVPIVGKFFPIIPLFVARADRVVPIYALIDSGAIVSLFNSGIGRALGIEIEKGEPFRPTGIGGQILTYMHEVVLKIGDVELKTKVAFTDQLALNINLLGREGFFDNFSVLFNDKERKVTIEKI